MRYKNTDLAMGEATTEEQKNSPESSNNAKAFIEALIGGLRLVILEYKENHKGKGISTQDIAGEAKSSYTTINGILGGKHSSMKLETILQISERLEGPTSIGELLAKFQREQRDGASPHIMFPTNDVMSEKMKYFVKRDHIYSRVIWAALNSQHTTREEIAHGIGQVGLDALEVLLKEGILKEEQGAIMGFREREYGMDFEDTRRYLQILTQCWEPNKEGNLACVASKGVTKEFAKRIYGRLYEVFQEFDEGSDLPENEGEVHIAIGLVMSNFLKNLKKNENNKVTIQ